MVRARIYIKEYDWQVDCYFAKTCYYVYEILDNIRRIGCSRETMAEAHRNLMSANMNTGLCYSNRPAHRSVLVTSVTTTPQEFLNSLMHEITHLTNHISIECGIDATTEEPCYLAGEIAEQVYPYVKGLLCCKCRKHE